VSGRLAGLALVAALTGCAPASEPAAAPPLPPSRVPPDLVARLRSHVDALAGEIGRRCRPDALRRAAEYVRAELTAAELVAVVQPFGDPGDSLANVSVEPRGGSAATRVVVGAHYDTVCETPGADDNASGVAVLIELARISGRGAPGAFTRFIAFANEERPERGSHVAAHASRDAGEALLGMIGLEMLGYYREERGTQRAAPGLEQVAGTRGDYIAMIGDPDSRDFLAAVLDPFQRVAAIRVRPLLVSPSRAPDVRRSDHASYWNVGYPAIMLTDTANFRNPNYHEPSDTPDTLDYARMGEITLGLAAALASLVPRP
jgi:Zn-dependent M28 family amino/carboxypeptidase